MDKIRLGLFDIFAYLLPGCFTLFSLVVLASPGIDCLAEMLDPFKGLSISEGILLVLASYMLGFAMHIPGWWMLKYIGLNIWKTYKRRTSQLQEIKERNQNTVLVREFSKVNARYVELWYALSSMARTLSLSFLFFTVVALIKAFSVEDKAPWIWLAAGLFFFSFVLLYRGAQAYSWAVRDLKNTVKVLHLKKKAELLMPGDGEEEEREYR